MAQIIEFPQAPFKDKLNLTQTEQCFGMYAVFGLNKRETNPKVITISLKLREIMRQSLIEMLKDEGVVGIESKGNYPPH